MPHLAPPLCPLELQRDRARARLRGVAAVVCCHGQLRLQLALAGQQLARLARQLELDLFAGAGLDRGEVELRERLDLLLALPRGGKDELRRAPENARARACLLGARRARNGHGALAL